MDIRPQVRGTTLPSRRIIRNALDDRYAPAYTVDTPGFTDFVRKQNSDPACTIPTIDALHASHAACGILHSNKQLRAECIAAARAAVGVSAAVRVVSGGALMRKGIQALHMHSARQHLQVLELRLLTCPLARPSPGMLERGLNDLFTTTAPPQTSSGQQHQQLPGAPFPALRRLHVVVETNPNIRYLHDDSMAWMPHFEPSYGEGGQVDAYKRVEVKIGEPLVAAHMLLAHVEVQGLLAWVPPRECGLREFSVMVRENVGLAIVDVAGKVLRRRVLDAPFVAVVERWGWDLSFFEAMWGWLNALKLGGMHKERKERMFGLEAALEWHRKVVSERYFTRVAAARLTAHVEDAYYAWVNCGKPSSERILAEDLDKVGGPLACLYDLDR
ncbi:hypothetical protein SLS58_009617 [Diplodia intermedia]|uniref:Uncharacterized protein n=1 Tax=Diplodia intermedia TaxID=856260 RepID=A0ABR3TB48_9PEZI